MSFKFIGARPRADRKPCAVVGMRHGFVFSLPTTRTHFPFRLLVRYAAMPGCIPTTAAVSIKMIFLSLTISNLEIKNLNRQLQEEKVLLIKGEVGEKLIDADPWFANEVFFVGSSFECFCQILFYYFDQLILNLEFSPDSISEYEFVLNQIHRLEGDILLDEIKQVVTAFQIKNYF